MGSHPIALDELQQLDDAELLRLARASVGEGDAGVETAKRSVAVVIGRHRSVIRAYLAGGAPAEAVDDLESQVLLRFVRRVYTGREITHPIGLLMRMAQRVRADYFADRDPREGDLEGWEQGEEDAGLDEIGCAEAVEQLLAPLNERQRYVVWERIVAGRPSAEVAADLDTTAGNVDVILYRSLGELREALA
jgi:RNA polymerase sigma factor (sigma-70 family)